MRAKVIQLEKENGVSLPGIGLRTLTKIFVGQDIAPDLGGGKISDIRVDGPLILVYKTTADGKPCRDFGRQVGGKHIEADGVAFPVHLCKSFLFVLDQEDDEMAKRVEDFEQKAARLTAERDELAKQVEQLTAPKQDKGQKGK